MQSITESETCNRILLVTATDNEVQPFLDSYQWMRDENTLLFHTRVGSLDVHHLTTGPGIMLTSFRLATLLAHHSFALCINAGFAGSYDRQIKLGEVVQVIQEEVADLGAENDQQFIPLRKMSFFDENWRPFSDGKLKHPNPKLLEGIKNVKGVTVNRVTGSEGTISLNKEHFEAEVESMEGAAFFYATLLNNIEFYQFRAISNRVQKRNPALWDMNAARNALCAFLEQFITNL